MSGVTRRDVAYATGQTRMCGWMLSPTPERRSSTVLLLHDAFGLGDFARAEAEGYAGLGYAVFAADVWGGIRPTSVDEIGRLIGSMVADRGEWLARLSSALDTARAQPEVDPDRIALVGYCFGGSSALELVRTGAGVRGAVAIHPGLDLLDPRATWTTGSEASVLVCIGDDDPMATPAHRDALRTGLSGAGVAWEVDVYGGTVHAFTNPALATSPDPAVLAYNPRSAARAAAATELFLAETLHTTNPAPAGAAAPETQEDEEDK